MAKTLLVIFMLMHDGSVKTEMTEHELTCPPQPVVFAKYEAKKKANEIVDWAASCVGIKFDKKPTQVGV